MKIHKASIALISIIILTGFTLLLALSMSEINATRSLGSLNSSTQNESLYAAEGCLEEALLRLEADPSFTSETLSFDTDKSCNISVSGTNPITVNIEMIYDTYMETYSAKLTLLQNGSANNIYLDSWGEI